MSLDFPTPPPANGGQYIDDCGNVWVYDDTDNKWTLKAPVVDVDPDSIWVRDTGTGKIKPINSGDDLDMAAVAGNIDVQSFPEIT
jgi:hypothetical protein